MEDKFVTADRIVEEVLGDTYDEGGVLKEKYYRWLFRVWKQLTQDFIREPVSVILPVNPLTKTVPLPADYVEWTVIGYIDCDRVIPIKINPSIPPSSLQDKRRCNTCNNLSLSDIVYETITEDVTVKDEHYVKTVNKMVMANGQYVEETISPVVRMDGTVEMETIRKVLCNLEKDNCGCVKVCPANMAMLLENGCTHEYCCCRLELNCPTAGSVNIFSNEGYIQLSQNSGLNSIYLRYTSNALRSNGVSYFPAEYEEVLIAGLYMRSIEKKKNIPQVQWARAKKIWNDEVNLMHKRKSRVSLQVIKQIFAKTPRL